MSPVKVFFHVSRLAEMVTVPCDPFEHEYFADPLVTSLSVQELVNGPLHAAEQSDPMTIVSASGVPRVNVPVQVPANPLQAWA